MRKKIQEKMYEFGYILELIISIIVALAVVALSIRLLITTVNSSIFDSADDALVKILDSAMTLAIGVEFIKMLCRHTPETVIEVLLFAIARQLVVLHTSAIENLITIISVAILLAVRKYLLRDDDRVHGFFRNKKKVLNTPKEEKEIKSEGENDL